MTLFLQLQVWLALALSVAQLAVVSFAVFDAVPRRPALFPAAGKLTKTKWLLILAVALVLQVLLFWDALSFLRIIGTAAGIIYLVDVRPALQQVTRGGSGNGPYG